MVWMSYQQAKKGPLTLFTDVMYASVANSDSFLISKTFSPHVSGTIGAALSADYQYWIVEGGGTRSSTLTLHSPAPSMSMA